MPKSDSENQQTLETLGTILLASQGGGDREKFDDSLAHIRRLPIQAIEDLLERATSQRVLRRSLEVLEPRFVGDRPDASQVLGWKLQSDRERSQNLLAVLDKIVRTFERRGYPVLAMKTLDHWPDTGSDVDLLASGDDHEICGVLERDFGAVRQTQSWGDRLAHKFNFTVPGLGELVEIHIGCLGQTGEQKRLADGVLSRRMQARFDSYTLPVPTQEDRIIIATLQRMYRHYYIRLTDIVNIFGAVRRNAINFEKLQDLASESSVWPGVATLLTIVCEHGVRFGGGSVSLPPLVTAATKFDSDRTYVDRKFVRVPLMPEAANLYMLQLAENGRSRNVRAVARLTLLPILATAAFVSFRFTGNDKGIW
jgi:hypothetical protein